MKHISLALLALAVSAIGASAADMAARPYTKAPVAPAPAVSWTGCYLGANVGYGWSDKDFYVPLTDPFTPGELLASHSATGVVAGGQIGCDYQFGGRWVVGIQGMGAWSDVKGASPIIANPVAEYATHIRSFATATVRFGWLATPNFLLYGKAGMGWVDDHFDQNRNVASPGLPAGRYAYADTTRSGLALGVGGEYLIFNNWSVFAEYNYINLGGTKSTTFVSTALSPVGAGNLFNIDVRQPDLQVVLIGLNYRFNMAGPVVAKY